MTRIRHAALALTGSLAILVGASGGAWAATPIWQPGGGGAASGPTAPDPNNAGTLSFYDANGNQISSGSTTTGIPYVVASPLPGAGGANHVATLYAYTPNPGSAAGAWSSSPLSGPSTFPATGAPAPISGFASNQAVVADNGTEVSLDDYSTNSFPNTSTVAGYANVYELRVLVSGIAAYASADVTIDPVAKTWTQIFPTPPVTAATTTTSLQVDQPSPQPAGSTPTITLTAGVTSPGGNPTGTVTFFSGSTQVGSSQTYSGTGTVSVTTTPDGLGVGTHVLTAVYTPDSLAFAGSTSTATNDTVLVGTTTTVTPTAGGDGTDAHSSQTFTATVTAASGTALPAGSVTFTDSLAGLLTSVPVQVTGSGNQGTATVTTTSLGAGQHIVTAAFTPADSTAFAGSTGQTSPFTLNPTTAAGTATSLQVDPMSPQTVGSTSTITLTAGVTSAGGNPAGTVTFLSDGNAIAAAQSFSGTGTVSVTTTPAALGVGTHLLTAAFASADPSTFANSASQPTSYHIAPVQVGTTTTVSDTGTSTAGTQQTLTATVSAASGTALPAGTVTFSDSVAGTLAAVPVTGSASPGTASYATNALGAGAHTVTATFAPSDTEAFAGSSGSTQAFTLTAASTGGGSGSGGGSGTGGGSTTAATTTTQFGAVPSSVTYGTPFTLSATVSAGNLAAPVGSIDFYDGKTKVGNAPVNSSGKATLQVTPAVGSHSYTATFVPTDTTAFGGSTSAAVSVTVAKASTTTKLVASSATATAGTAITLTATVTPATASGTVAFSDNGVVIGTVTVASGTAVQSFAGVVGTHTLKAAFTPGDSNSTASTSADVAVTVTAPALGGGAAAAAVAPTQLTAPRLTGPGKVGTVETVVTGTWAGSPSPTFAIQWLHNGKPILGANGVTYLLAGRDCKQRITVRLTARNSAGSVQVVTGILKPGLGAKPKPVKGLGIKGTAKVGKKLTAVPGSWSAAGLTFHYQWRVNGKAVKNATRSTFTPSASQRHQKVTVVVTATEMGFPTAAAASKAVTVS